MAAARHVLTQIRLGPSLPAPTATVVLSDAQQLPHFGLQAIPLPLQSRSALQRCSACVLQLRSGCFCRLAALVRLCLQRRTCVRLTQQVSVQAAVLCREAPHFSAEHLHLQHGCGGRRRVSVDARALQQAQGAPPSAHALVAPVAWAPATNALPTWYCAVCPACPASPAAALSSR